MVVLVDLDDEAEPPELRAIKQRHWSERGIGRHHSANVALDDGNTEIAVKRPNPNKNALTEALGCYPIISEIASLIDLNSLDNLSQTCRQVRANLIQFRSQLILKTLRCSNEDVVLSAENTLRNRARAVNWYVVEPGNTKFVEKVGSCARDMVSECRQCNRVVCRNCTIKPPASNQLQNRHRRLCPTCIKAPLSLLMFTSSLSSSATPSDLPAYSRSICTCVTEGVWLCQPCGRGLCSADQTYVAIWRWRNRYRPTLGGLGTGISEGNRSFVCGRGAQCLAARLVEEETDCDAEDAREIDATATRGKDVTGGGVIANGGVDGATGSANSSPGLSTLSAPLGPGYTRHEIEGIGGVVKTKRVKMVKIGACVSQWEDETERGRYLAREIEGRTRSWCGWCGRVIPTAHDIGKGELET